MNALSKAAIAETLYSELNISKQDGRVLVDEFFVILRPSLEHGENVKLSGFGNVILRDNPQRPGRNPKTGEDIPVLARRVVTFKSGLKLKSTIEQRD